MKKKSILLLIGIVIGIISLILPKENLAANNNLLPTASDNIQISLKSKSSLVPLSSGYMRVFYDKINNNIGIEYYDDNFKIIKKNKIELELSVYGGFYAGKDAYYIVEGQNNKQEDNSLEVVRVIKYDTNWKRIGSAKITGQSGFGEQIGYPFHYGCVEMTEVNGKLYIVTGHRGYVDPAVGQGHQGFLMMEVDESTLEGKIVDADLWHSFAQYIEHKDNNLYVLEQSEGSRRTQVTRYDISNKFKTTLVPTLEYGGDRTSVWAVSCYASVDGMALSQNNVLGIGTSIDQSKYDEVTQTMAHNIYLTITPMNNFSSESTTLKWLTNYVGDGHSFTGLEITKINDNRFMISWEEFNETTDMIDNDTLSTSKLHYIFIDGNGNKLGKEYTANATISDCKPVVKGNKIVYYASNDNMVDFYTIDSTTGKFSKVMYRVAGENATWSLDNNGVLTISGNGKFSVDIEAKHRTPLSSIGGFGYSDIDNSWKPIREFVKKIVVKEGITNIPDKEFKSFPNLSEVILPSSMKNIGKSAFEYCSNLRKILIPSSVTSIGDNALWSGYYSYNYEKKLCFATIYGTKGAYAESWAKQNDATYKYVENLTLKDAATGTVLKVLGESTTNLSVNILEKNNNDYIDMKNKVSDKVILYSYSITTNNGTCFGDNELTFNIGKIYKEKNITILQKKSNGNIEVVNKKVDNNGNIVIKTDELLSFVFAIDKKDIAYLLGDVDGNGKVDAQDAVMILKYVAHNITLNEQQLLAANTTKDKDGRVDAQDAVQILKYVAHNISEF